MPSFTEQLEKMRLEAQRFACRSPDIRFDVGRIRDYEQVAALIPELRRAIADATLAGTAHISRAIDRVAALAFALGDLSKRAELRLLEPELHAGTRVRKGAKAGAQRKHGSAEAKNTKHLEWANYYTTLRAKKPKLGHVAATDKTGEHFGVTGRTIRKHVKNPRK